MPQKEEAKTSVDLVHFHHTCDCCSKTPIIGKRYHSKGKDLSLDLCEKCFKKIDEQKISIHDNLEFVLATDGKLHGIPSPHNIVHTQFPIITP